MGSHFNPQEHSGHATEPLATDTGWRHPAHLDHQPARRRVLRGGVGAALAALFTPAADSATGLARSAGASALIGFDSIAVSSADRITLPPGYQAQVLYAWGDAIGHPQQLPGSPVFALDNSAAEQSLQAGMHHDGMHFFPFRNGNHGLLVLNHEYTDDGLLHAGGMSGWNAEKVKKAQAAQGNSVIEIRRDGSGGAWRVVRPSRYARRITANTPMRLSGPAAGDDALKTIFDAAGAIVQGSLANCAHGFTPWGTYLSCEENWQGYFEGRHNAGRDEARYGIRPGGFGYRWHEFDARFDVAQHPNEPNRFGWIVEFDPFDPDDMPVKRTALGRIKREAACTVLTRSRRAVIYSGDDERFEYIYKFVTRDAVRTGGYRANRTLLDHGTLYAARFNDDGSGTWLALVHGENGLTRENGFTSQADVLIRTRQAADRAGATPMDRPEWITHHPATGDMFVTLTNNVERGKPGKPGVDRANPRADNVYGHILSWREMGGADARSFSWKQFLLAGDPSMADAEAQGGGGGSGSPGGSGGSGGGGSSGGGTGTGAKSGVGGDTGFGSPDGLWIDPRGVMWIQTDVSTSALDKGPYARLGNNQMLAADPATGEVRRFLTGPRGCEITGVITSPDLRSMFVNIQHPGEPAAERSDPARPGAISTWPHTPGIERPRSATIVITRIDGGIIGT